MLTSKEIAHLAVKALDDKLARDIQILKTDKVTVLADYFILCTAGNSTHGKTLADEVDKVLSQAGRCWTSAASSFTFSPRKCARSTHSTACGPMRKRSTIKTSFK